MTKEEILEKSRQENKGADLVTLDISNKSRGIAGAGTLVLGAVIHCIVTFLYDIDFTIFWVIFFGYSSIQGISYFILTRIKGKVRMQDWLWLAYGLFMLCFTVIAICKLFAELQSGGVYE